MPMVNRPASRRLPGEGKAILEAIHAGLDRGTGHLDDLFQVFRPHDDGELVFSPDFGGADRQDLILLRITMAHMFPVDTKRRMYKALVQRLEQAGVRRDDILVCVVDVGFDDWYAGAPVDE